MRILMIHGRSQGGKDPLVLQEIWANTLKSGFKAANKTFPENVAIDFPYYGDKLDEYTEQGNLPTSEEFIAKGTGQNQNFANFLESALIEIKERAKIEDVEVASQMTSGKTQKKGPGNWGWVQAIARVLDSKFAGFTDFTIEAFLKDVYLYVNNDYVTKGINQIVQDKLSDEPTIVIGHSLGSVVGYKVLKENAPIINVVKYVTVGSPLGIRAISSKLGIVENPSGQNGWYNAYDESDIVALNPLDNKYFPTEPEIVNNSKIKNHTDNKHGIIGYLNDAEVARQISDALNTE